MTRDDETKFIQAIHAAMQVQFAKIAQETTGGSPINQATRNRWKRYAERLRLDLLNAKTATQTRTAVVELLARAGSNKQLRDSADYFPEIRDLLARPDDWQVLRDLSLLAVISYRGKGDRELDDTDSDTDSDAESPATDAA